MATGVNVFSKSLIMIRPTLFRKNNLFEALVQNILTQLRFLNLRKKRRLVFCSNSSVMVIKGKAKRATGLSLVISLQW